MLQHGVAATSTALFTFAKHAVEFAAKIEDMAVKVGLSAEKFQEYSFALGQSGVSQEEFTSGVGKMNKLLGEARQGNEKAITTFQKLGFTLDEIQNLSTEDAFLKVGDGLSFIKDGALQAAIGAEAFGKSNMMLVRAAADGSESLKDQARATRDLRCRVVTEISLSKLKLLTTN